MFIKISFINLLCIVIFFKIIIYNKQYTAYNQIIMSQYIIKVPNELN